MNVAQAHRHLVFQTMCCWRGTPYLQPRGLLGAVLDTFAVAVVGVVQRLEEGQEDVGNVLQQWPLLTLPLLQFLCRGWGQNGAGRKIEV